jgi:hypothetical protein
MPPMFFGGAVLQAQGASELLNLVVERRFDSPAVYAKVSLACRLKTAQLSLSWGSKPRENESPC